MGYKRYTELEKTLICELCKVTNNILYVVKVTGVHRNTINKFLDEKGIEISEKDKLFERDIQAIELYNRVREGDTLSEISKEIGKDNKAISHRLSTHRKKFNKDEINAWKNITAKKDEEAEKWCKLIELGEKTMRQIADDEGLSISGVSKRVKRYLKRNNLDKDFRYKNEKDM